MTNLKNAEENLCNRVGPRGLSKLVKEKQKHGILLPFVVSIRKNSKFALVGWELSIENVGEYLEV
jgi:hypothetical protein